VHAVLGECTAATAAEVAQIESLVAKFRAGGRPAAALAAEVERLAPGSAAGLPFLRQLACGQMFAMHAFRKSAGDDAGPVHGAGPHRATHAAQRVLAANP
jgi:hypothetical protein